jgi:hypothetical protein
LSSYGCRCCVSCVALWVRVHGPSSGAPAPYLLADDCHQTQRTTLSATTTSSTCVRLRSVTIAHAHPRPHAHQSFRLLNTTDLSSLHSTLPMTRSPATQQNHASLQVAPRCKEGGKCAVCNAKGQPLQASRHSPSLQPTSRAIEAYRGGTSVHNRGQCLCTLDQRKVHLGFCVDVHLVER